MFAAKVNNAALTVSTKETLTSGARETFSIRFTFSEVWAGLTKRAVFKAGDGDGAAVTAEVDESGVCVIPSEVLASPNKVLYAGIYGSDGGGRVLPTVWAQLGKIEEGVAPGGEAEACGSAEEAVF